MNVTQKEIVLISYPFSDLEGKKVRPAVVISSNNFNKKSNDCVMIPLTTVINDKPYSILLNQNDLDKGKLLKPSRIRVDKIFTVEKKLIVMSIGFIGDNIFGKIKKELSKILENQ